MPKRISLPRLSFSLFVCICSIGIAIGQQSGTTGLIPSPRTVIAGAEASDINTFIEQEKSYFTVRIVGTSINVPEQNWVSGLFRRAKKVTLTSSASVNNSPVLPPGTTATSIHAVQDISPGQTFKIGAGHVLIDQLPAMGTSVNISVEFRVTEEGDVAKALGLLGPTINNQQGLSKALMVPEATIAPIASTTALASSIITQFFPVTSERTTLRFTGVWPLNNGMKSQYYFILGSYDKNQLPSGNDLSNLRVTTSGRSDYAYLVDKNNVEFNRASYIIFEVRQSKTNPGLAPSWRDIYSRSEEDRELFNLNFPSPTQEQRREAWAKCDGLIQQAKAFADRDMRFLPSEKRSSYDAARKGCLSVLTGNPVQP